MANLYVANTDNAWFDFLFAHQPHEEVNFWKPSRQIFKAIDEGELFLFRLKAPRNVIGGYGILASSINAPIKFAWDSLGDRNGVASLEEMVNAIAKYRQSRDTTPHSEIGCRILVQPVFFAPDQWFPVPQDWSSNIVTGKTYDLESREGAELLRQIEERTDPATLFERDRKAFEGPGMSDTQQARWGAPTLRKPRLGQGAFRIKVAAAYGFSCPISDTRVLPALDAAHIRPFSAGGHHSVANGILMRKDIHSVFDEGFATFDEDYRFVVSSEVQHRFNNGNEYRRLHGKRLQLPPSPSQYPSPENLKWHREHVFVGV
jgi:putative restriction endonuclease